MCGPEDSVLGRSVESVVWRFKTGLPTRFPVAKGPVRLCGAIVDVDPATGACLSVHRVSQLLEEEPAAAPAQASQSA
jgi:calcineurin-like phosphoesterase